MATPMPAELDVSKILVLALDNDGAPKIEQLNVEFSERGDIAARSSSPRS
jgi:hypothetical protein